MKFSPVTSKILKFSYKKFWYFFLFFCSKNRLWVLVRTASMRRFWRVPTIYALSRNKRKIYTPINTSFTIQKWGLRGSKLYRHVFVINRGIHIFLFLFLDKNIYCGYSLEAPRRGASNECLHHRFSWRKKNNITFFRMKTAHNLEVGYIYILQNQLILWIISEGP